MHNYKGRNWVWVCMSIIPAQGRLKQKNGQYEAKLDTNLKIRNKKSDFSQESHP